MTRGDHDPPAQPLLLDGQQCRRCGDEPEVAHPAPYGLQPGRGGRHQRRPAQARIAPDGHVIAPTALLYVRTERGGDLGDHLGVQVDAHTPPNTGDADDECVR